MAAPPGFGSRWMFVILAVMAAAVYLEPASADADARVPSVGGGGGGSSGLLLSANDGLGGASLSSAKMRGKFPWTKLWPPPIGKQGVVGGSGDQQQQQLQHQAPPSPFHPALTPILAVPCRGGCNCTRAGPSRLFADCSAVLATPAATAAADRRQQQYYDVDDDLDDYRRRHRTSGRTRLPEYVERLYIPRNVTNLDFSHNNISVIEKDDFRKFEHMDELILDGNRLAYIHPDAFAGGIPPLRILSLRKNNLSEVPWEALKPLTRLEILHLDENSIEEIPKTAFVGGLEGIRQLFLARNLLESVPHAALGFLVDVEAINLASNRITRIHGHDFANLTKLEILNVGYNQITEIDEDAFSGLHSLKIVELNGNLLDRVPPSLSQLDHLQELTLANNRITYVPELAFRRNTQLSLLELKGNPIITMDRGAFSHLPHLKKLIISDIRDLKEFPDLNGTSSLELLTVDRASIKHVPADLCDFAPQLKALDLKSCELEEMPDLRNCTKLKFLDLEHNHIEHLDGMAFKTLGHLSDLLLGGNRIRKLSPEAFIGLSQLQVLDVSDNLIDDIHPDAFLPLVDLQDLNLGNNKFPLLPENGLQSVRHLKVHNIPQLRDFPPPESFPKVHTLALSYAYHCCQFLPDSSPFGGVEAATESTFLDQLQESWYIPEKGDKFDESLWNNMNMSDFWPGFYENISERFGDFAGELFDNFGDGYPNNFPSYIEYLDQQTGNTETFLNAHTRTPIKCIPKPGPFMPCQDLFDWWALRCGVWIVFLLALLGNGAVVSVLILARSKMDVPRFLVCNLAAADFFMGIYLGFLAVVDAMTLGEFRRYAIPWQMSPACQVAGFMGVLSSELSVYTLAVITLERNYAITHAMHLNKRLSLRHASYIMVCGWTFALVMAVLPLTGISDYRKFAVCLPFETGDGASLGYVIFLMFINGVAFVILMGCYLKMYCAIRGSQAWNSNDSRIAKRMALLVFTDFSCWAPIAFFSLTSAFGVHLISLEGAKVFTVFILPLNSCCNPFLYAIMTKQFKKDCVLICKAIEESRVTRGIGRCRHSSNFSNRHTPANTNSTGDRNSNQSAVKDIPCTCKKKPHTSACLENQRRSRKVRNKNRWWNRFQTLFSHKNPAEQLESVDSSNYTYQIAEMQQKPNPKTVRNHSVSSDNFSSSRSDSMRHANCTAIPMRMMNRRRNSWTYTRRGSQDSNLSNSRNDSSAASNSTATWRISRSSVSSDTSHGTGPRGPYGSFKDRRASENFHHLPAGRMSSMRFKQGLEGKPSFPPQLMKQPSAGLLKNLPPGAGPRPILKQSLLATGSNGSQLLSSSGSESPALSAGASAGATGSTGGLSWPSSIAHRQDSFNNGRNGAGNGKPRLKRQVAIQELDGDQQLLPPGLGKVVSFEPTGAGTAVMFCCPVHPDRVHTRHFEDLIESSHEADEEEEEEEEEGDEEDEEEEDSEGENSDEGNQDPEDAEHGRHGRSSKGSSSSQRGQNHSSSSSSMPGSSSQGSFLGGLGGFIPRKLSTISSMSQRSSSSATQKDAPTTLGASVSASAPASSSPPNATEGVPGEGSPAAAGSPTSSSQNKSPSQSSAARLNAAGTENGEDPQGEDITQRTCSCDCIISPETTAWLANLPKVKLKTKCSSENELTRRVAKRPSPMKGASTSATSGAGPHGGRIKVVSSCTNIQNFVSSTPASDSPSPSPASWRPQQQQQSVRCPKAVFDVYEDDEMMDEDEYDDVFVAPPQPSSAASPSTAPASRTGSGKLTEAGTSEEKASLLLSTAETAGDDDEGPDATPAGRKPKPAGNEERKSSNSTKNAEGSSNTRRLLESD